MEQQAGTPAKRTGGRSARVRQAVLEAAMQELTEKGYEHFNIASVAKLAGVHETSIYRRWGTRNALLIDAVSEVGHAPVPDTGSLRGDLCQLLSDSRTLMQTPVGRTLGVLAIGAEPGKGGFYEPLKQFWQHRIAELEAIFARAAERGEWDAAV
ncbi:MAG TPA: TetR/AcrR family transcriptional regulator, partial [Telluria sp.]|nr:TetR/AcrR family transcriptional regulator [Telluria sp.]